MRIISIALAIIAFLVAHSTCAVGMDNCKDPSLNEIIKKAAEHNLGVKSLENLLKDVSKNSDDCAPRIAYCVSLMINIEHLELAYKYMDKQPPDLIEASKELSAGKQYSLSWQSLVAEGDIDSLIAHNYSKRNLYAEASIAYHLALKSNNSIIRCADFGELNADDSQTKDIRRRGREILLLSPRYALPDADCDCCRGLLIDGNCRGVRFTRITLPFSFADSEVSLDENKRHGLSELMRCMDKKSNFKIYGHADVSETDRDAIAKRRAEAVAEYLRHEGYSGALKTVSLGTQEPFLAFNPTLRSLAELQQLNRRVEIAVTPSD